MFSRIAHMCLNVKDLQRSLDYYTRLGFESCFRFTRSGQPFGAYLRLTDHQFIEIFENPAMEAPINTGIAHFCLESENIDVTIEQLQKRDIAFTPKKMGCDHTYQIWLEDPDGNRFEIHQYTPQSLQYCGGTVEADW